MFPVPLCQSLLCTIHGNVSIPIGKISILVGLGFGVMKATADWQKGRL